MGLAGPSGSGKSTIGRIMAGLDSYDAGEVVFRGVDVGLLEGNEKVAYHQKVQMISQDPLSALPPHRPVRDFLADVASLRPDKNIVEEIACLAPLVGLDDKVLSRIPKRLSGGERQRVLIMRAAHGCAVTHM